MMPTLSELIARDHISDLRNDARLAHLSERGRRTAPSARQRLGHGLVLLGEKLISGSPVTER